MARQRRTGKSSAIDIAGLSELELTELRRLWKELLESEPLARISRELLVRAIAHRLQEQREGGLSSKEQRQLDRLVDELETRGQITSVAASVSAKAGTRLVREWQGTLHEVVVLESGISGRERRIDHSRRLPARSPARAGQDRASSASSIPGLGNAMSHSQTIRCAVYTRKSSEEGLEQSFNSLHAQREACEAYIKSQKA